jgi:hypothetical protein
MSNDLNVSIASFPIQFTIPALEPALLIQPAYEMEIFDDLKEVLNYLGNQPATLFIVPVHNKNDLSRLSVLVRESRKKNLKVKFVIVSRLGHQVDKFAAKLGILDFIEVSTSTKALRYKLDYWVKSLKAQIKKDAIKEANKPKTLAEKDTQGEKKISEYTPVWVDPMDCPDDMWLIRNEADCRRVLNKWLVRLRGPSPYVGKWTDSDIKGCWEFKLKDAQNAFCGPKGKWYFRGSQKPEFIWKDNVWLLVGDQYELFYQGEQGIQSRVTFKEKVLTVSKNSEYAKAKENAIIESFDKDLVYSAENAEAAKETLIEDDASKFDPLKGKGKTDHIDGGPLAGKQKTTDEIEAAPLSGKGKTDDLSSPLLARKLKEGEQNLGSDKLGLELGQEEDGDDYLEDGKHKTEHLSGFYGKKKKEETASEQESEAGDMYGHAAAKAAKESRKTQEADEEQKDLNRKQKADEEKERKKRVAELKAMEQEYSQSSAEKQESNAAPVDHLNGKSHTDDVTTPLLSTVVKKEEENKKKDEHRPVATLSDLLTRKKTERKESVGKASEQDGPLNEEDNSHSEFDHETEKITKDQKKKEKAIAQAAALAIELQEKKQKKDSHQEKPSKFAPDMDPKQKKEKIEASKDKKAQIEEEEKKSPLAGGSSTDHLDAFYGRKGESQSSQDESENPDDEMSLKDGHGPSKKIQEKLSKKTAEKKKIKEAKEKDIVDQIVDEFLDEIDVAGLEAELGLEQGFFDSIDETEVQVHPENPSTEDTTIGASNVIELASARKSKESGTSTSRSPKDHAADDARQARLKAIFEKAAQQYKRANG